MSLDPSECPEHVWASVGVTVIGDQVNRIWNCERCAAWTNEPLEEDRRVEWSETALSG
jgi:hypothetical protein